jgi:hypothetical protein
MKFNANVASIHANARNQGASPAFAPAFRRNRLDSVFHVLLLAAGFALAVDAALQSAFDTAMFDGIHAQFTVKAPVASARAAETAPAAAADRDATTRARFKS